MGETYASEGVSTPEFEDRVEPHRHELFVHSYRILGKHVFGTGKNRLVATAANGLPAFAICRQMDERGPLTALGIQVLTAG